jgi:hypothetical protein
MKHNKKRNTGFIYETLSRELTKAIVNRHPERKVQIVSILKEFFSGRLILARELELYTTLLETKYMSPKVAERLLQEAKATRATLDESALFDAQSHIIMAINKKLGSEVWGNFIPNFKSLASVNAIFNSKTAVKKKVLFEQALVDRMSAQGDTAATDPMRPVDNLTYSSFIGKFNDKYGNLVQEQKDLLNRYITSFADDGFELRLYLNEELSRLKDTLSNSAAAQSEPAISTRVKEVVEYLDEFKKREFTTTDLSKILKTQELVVELAQND